MEDSMNGSEKVCGRIYGWAGARDSDRLCEGSNGKASGRGQGLLVDLWGAMGGAV